MTSVSYSVADAWVFALYFAADFFGRGRRSSVHVVLKERDEFGPAFSTPLFSGSHATAIEHY